MESLHRSPARSNMRAQKQEGQSGTNELDFSSQQVLIVGGSGGIGNGIAQTFRGRGAKVHVCGTRGLSMAG